MTGKGHGEGRSSGSARPGRQAAGSRSRGPRRRALTDRIPLASSASKSPRWASPRPGPRSLGSWRAVVAHGVVALQTGRATLEDREPGTRACDRALKGLSVELVSRSIRVALRLMSAPPWYAAVGRGRHQPRREPAGHPLARVDSRLEGPAALQLDALRGTRVRPTGRPFNRFGGDVGSPKVYATVVRRTGEAAGVRKRGEPT